MEEIHYTKKDFKIEWYSGTGAGGQHRNRHCNCCRITHIESGLQENGTESRSRIENQKTAFLRLANKVIKWALDKQRIKININDEVIRNYNEYRNEVHDKASGLKRPYSDVVVSGDIAEMIEARALSQIGDNL
jgi:protein subunit release factor A